MRLSDGVEEVENAREVGQGRALCARLRGGLDTSRAGRRARARTCSTSGIGRRGSVNDVWTGGCRGIRTCRGCTVGSRFVATPEVSECISTSSKEDVYLPFVCRRCFLRGVDANVMEPIQRPMECRPMQLSEPSSLHLVPNDRDELRVPPRVLVKPSDGEQEVLERIQRVVFRRRASERRQVTSKHPRLRRQAEVRLRLGRRGVFPRLSAGRNL